MAYGFCENLTQEPTAEGGMPMVAGKGNGLETGLKRRCKIIEMHGGSQHSSGTFFTAQLGWKGIEQ
jgi:hypothetical protein